MSITRALLLIALAGCKPQAPPTGFGVPDTVTEEGLVDTDGDGEGDTPIENWCPEPALHNARWYEASCNLANVIGFNCDYTFRLRADGEIPLCLEGDIHFGPLQWACNEGDVEIYGKGVLAAWTDAAGLLATVEWRGTHYETQTPVGEKVSVEGALSGDREYGTLWYSNCGS